ncbi:hypothetical protein H5T87_02820 [bacterium]|nr:hypothetical protein [bacterium]
MPTRLVIRCSACGRRISQKNILQISFHYRLFGQSFVAIKYKCPRCKRVGEHMISENRWNASLLNYQKGELTPQEIVKFREMGKITPDEVLDFHLNLERSRNWLKELVK